MIEKPRPGDRVRLTTSDFEPEYKAGDLGIVESGPYIIPSGGDFYLVRMEKDGPDATPTIIRANELELVATADAKT